MTYSIALPQDEYVESEEHSDWATLRHFETPDEVIKLERCSGFFRNIFSSQYHKEVVDKETGKTEETEFSLPNPFTRYGLISMFFPPIGGVIAYLDTRSGVSDRYQELQEVEREYRKWKKWRPVETEPKSEPDLAGAKAEARVLKGLLSSST